MTQYSLESLVALHQELSTVAPEVFERTFKGEPIQVQRDRFRDLLKGQEAALQPLLRIFPHLLDGPQLLLESTEDADLQFVRRASGYLVLLEKLRILSPFFFHYCHVDSVQIQFDVPLDTAFRGSTSRVWEAALSQPEQPLAAKVMTAEPDDALNPLVLGIEQGVHLAIASHAQVGPGFYGFAVAPGNEVAVLMGKIEGFDLSPGDGSPSAILYITERTKAEIKDQLERLGALGFEFGYDAGQLLVEASGKPHLIDFDTLGRVGTFGPKANMYLNSLLDRLSPSDEQAFSARSPIWEKVRRALQSVVEFFS